MGSLAFGMKRTPFHERTSVLNEVRLWQHWVGYLAATRYQPSATVEYYAVRNTVGVFDASPLFKYRILGPDATELLTYVFTRDIRTCAVGGSHYTVWCDARGHVVEDGVVLRIAADDYLLTAARPNLRYLSRYAAKMDVQLTDISEEFGLLAVQGPHAFDVVEAVTAEPIRLSYFGVTITRIGNVEVIVSRTGYTGDLGYEIWVPASGALAVWDALFAAGAHLRILPVGLEALDIARIDAGLLQIDVDFTSSRFASIDAERETPIELGLGWMLRGIRGGDRDFVGRDAMLGEIETRATRWQTVGIMLDVESYERTYAGCGLIPPKEGVLIRGSLGLYSSDLDEHPGGSYVGYGTSLSWSPILKRHIAIAKLPVDVAAQGGEVYVELTVAHRPRYVGARVTPMPFYDPPRKVAATGGGAR